MATKSELKSKIKNLANRNRARKTGNKDNVAPILGDDYITLLDNIPTLADDVTFEGDLTVNGDATIKGHLTVGDSDLDSLTISADLASNLIPDADDTYDIGSGTKEWKNLFVDGTATIDTLKVDVLADIDGKELILDADADTSITADTDDQIDIKVAGADDFQITANKFEALSGSQILGASGAVGTPSVAVGATDTGLYLVSASQTGVSQDGTLVAIFDSEGIKPDSTQVRVAIGSTPVGTVTFKEYGDGKDITTVLTLTSFIVGALDGVAADKGIGNIVYEFPAGQHFELVYSLSSLVLTAEGTAVVTDTGLGSVIASGAIAVLSGTATFEDRLTGQAISTDPAGGAAVSALTAATAGIGTGISLNVAASVKKVFLNSAGTWNADNINNLTASGTIVLKWSRM